MSSGQRANDKLCLILAASVLTLPGSRFLPDDFSVYFRVWLIFAGAVFGVKL